MSKINSPRHRYISMDLRYVCLKEYSKEFFEIWGEEPTFVIKGDTITVTNQKYLDANRAVDDGIANFLNQTK